jgi:hypothetical protein
MKKNKFSSLVAVFILHSLLPLGKENLVCCAQSITNSPYSRYGLGEIHNTGFAHNTAMGGIAYALQNDTTAPFYINATNPASNASVRLTVFDFGVKNSVMKLETSDKKFISDRTGLAYMALAFPVSKWWGAGFGMLPYSNIGYKIYDKKEQDSIGTVNYIYEGTGGINQVYFSNGFKLGCFSIGANVSYLFGDLTYFSRDSFPASSNFFNTKSFQTTRVSDVYYSLGVQYSIALRKGWSLTLGASGNLASAIGIRKSIFAANYSDANGIEVLKDTVIYQQNAKSTISIPALLGGGFIFKKGDRWLFGFDYSTQKWSEFNYFGQQGLLKDNAKMALGMQFTPRKNAGSKESYFKKMFYRAGFRYSNTYLNLKNVPLNDYAFTMGVGLPLRKIKIMGIADSDMDQKYYQSSVNIGCEIGQRGTTVNQLIRERYINVFVSFSLNDKWFTKRKYD